jgi:hypothetical protein
LDFAPKGNTPWARGYVGLGALFAVLDRDENTLRVIFNRSLAFGRWECVSADQDFALCPVIEGALDDTSPRIWIECGKYESSYATSTQTLMARPLDVNSWYKPRIRRPSDGGREHGGFMIMVWSLCLPLAVTCSFMIITIEFILLTGLGSDKMHMPIIVIGCGCGGILVAVFALLIFAATFRAVEILLWRQSFRHDYNPEQRWWIRFEQVLPPRLIYLHIWFLIGVIKSGNLVLHPFKHRSRADKKD